MAFLQWKWLETFLFPISCTERLADRPTVICISTPNTHTPSFKVEVEGLLELVACDCVLMKERLQRGDKAASLGWEVLGGIRIIIKKSHVFKNTQWMRASPVILHSSLHPSTQTPVGQLTFQYDGLLLAVECDISSHHSLYRAKCAVMGSRWDGCERLRGAQTEREREGGDGEKYRGFQVWINANSW